jgi:glycosyltransferase involved in cell wall biosynthesis
MIHLFINAGSASAGGGLTYLRNLMTQLRRREDVSATILLTRQGEHVVSTDCEPGSSRLKLLPYPWRGSAALRYWREQEELPRMIRFCGADVLLSTGNVALRNSPVPQILLSGNALYTTPEFFRDLRTRRDYSLWITERCKGLVAKRSVHWADCTIAPSMAFARELQAWTGREVNVVHHGFDAKAFFASRNIPEELHRKLKVAEGSVRLLFVSHYNYYRNFETLLQALPLIRRQLAPQPVRLFLTCQLRSGMNPGSYRTNSAAALVRGSGISEEVVQLGAVPYESLHHLYKACDVYVTPAYAETFAHPLVEAMASGLPIVASDLPVHREICRDAATYVPTFSPAHYAEEIFSLIGSPKRKQQLAEAGRRRSADFSWVAHVDQIARIAKQMASARPLPLPITAAVPS